MLGEKKNNKVLLSKTDKIPQREGIYAVRKIVIAGTSRCRSRLAHLASQNKRALTCKKYITASAHDASKKPNHRLCSLAVYEHF